MQRQLYDNFNTWKSIYALQDEHVWLYLSDISYVNAPVPVNPTNTIELLAASTRNCNYTETKEPASIWYGIYCT